VTAGPFEATAVGDAFESEFGLSEAGGQSALELFAALTEAGAETSAATEADNELAEAALEDEQAAQQELDELLAEADSEQGGAAVEPGLDELLALLRNRPGLRLTLSY
jgi:hypothetical protein